MIHTRSKFLRVSAGLFLFFLIENLLFCGVNIKKPPKKHLPLTKTKASERHDPKPSPSVSPLKLSATSPSPTPTPTTSEVPQVPEPTIDSDEEEPKFFKIPYRFVLNFLITLAVTLIGIWITRKRTKKKEIDLDVPVAKPVPELPKAPPPPSPIRRKPRLSPNTPVFLGEDPKRKSETKPLPPILMKPHAILIDEDAQVRELWSSSAKAKNKIVFTYYSIFEFLRKAPEISPKVDIFIDAKLGTGLLGTPRSRKIYDLGFKRIFLTTSGTLPNQLPPWIAMVVSKTPPWGSGG
jgi:hypothetical protein